MSALSTASRACAVRWKNVLRAMMYYNLMRRYPALAKRRIERHGARSGGSSRRRIADISRRATTRGISVCASCPTAISSPRCGAPMRRSSPARSKALPRHGVRMQDGTRIDAELIVTATGPRSLDAVRRHVELDLDGAPLDPAQLISYKGTMFCGFRISRRARLYERLVDAQMRIDGTLRHAPAALSGSPADETRNAASPRFRCKGPQPAISLSSGYVTRGLARFRGKERARRGNSTKITRSISLRCATAASMMASCSGHAGVRAPLKICSVPARSAS